MVERSKSSILRSWMRKVVGSNLGDGYIWIVFLLWMPIEKRRLALIEKRRLIEAIRNDNNARPGNDNNAERSKRSYLNQSSLSGFIT